MKIKPLLRMCPLICHLCFCSVANAQYIYTVKNPSEENGESYDPEYIGITKKNPIRGPVKSIRYRGYTLPIGDEKNRILADSGYVDYDSLGRAIEESAINLVNRKTIKAVYAYEDGLLMERKVLADTTETKTTYKYNDKGKVIETISVDNEPAKGRTVYKYDNRGNNIEQDSYEFAVVWWESPLFRMFRRASGTANKAPISDRNSRNYS